MIDKRYYEYGCGQEAVFQMKNGKWCCVEMHAKCPQVRRKNTESQKGQKRHGGAYSTKGRTKLAESMTEAIRTKRDYQALGRKLFSVEPLPEGIKATYEKDI